MKYLSFLLLLISICIESTIIPFPLTLIVVILLSMMGTDISGRLFLTGVAYDLFTMRPLGGSGIFFLCVYWILSKYQRKLYLSGGYTSLVFVAISMLAYDIVFVGRVDLVHMVIGVLITAGSLFLLNRFYPSFDTS